MVKNEDLNITFLKTIGIVGVVAGHKYAPYWAYFDLGFFIIQIFIFISGYLYKDINNLKEYKELVIRRVKSLLIPYFIYNTFYAILTFLIYIKYDILLGQFPNFENFFLSPFIHGHQYLLYMPAWFVPYLFLINIFFPIIYLGFKKIYSNSYLMFLILFIASSICIYGINNGEISGLTQIFISKIIVGTFFFYYGLIFHNNLEKRKIFSGGIILPLLIFESIVISLFPPTSIIYSGLVVRGIPSCIFLLISMSTIYLLFVFSKSITKTLKSNDFLFDIGRNSFHIMANHILIFFLINIVIFKLNHIPDYNWGVLHDVLYAYKPQITWPGYLLAGITLPVLVSKGVNILRVKALERFSQYT